MRILFYDGRFLNINANTLYYLLYCSERLAQYTEISAHKRFDMGFCFSERTHIWISTAHYEKTKFINALQNLALQFSR